jgi:hypothetical protein
MEQIDGHRVGLSHRVSRGLAHELISYGQNHEKMSHFGISTTKTSKDTVSFSSSTFQNPETRNLKSAQEPFWNFSYWDFKGHGVSIFLYILKPRNAKYEKHPGAISAFWLPRLQRTRGLTLPLHFETLKHEM